MNSLRLLFILLYVLVAGYALVAGINQGWNLFDIFFTDLASLEWRGQFNIDFTSYLILSALWVAWRHHFTIIGLGLGFLALIGGMMFFSLYLLYTSFIANGDIKILLLGKRRANNELDA